MSETSEGLQGISLINIPPFFSITHQPGTLKCQPNPLKPRTIA